MKRPTLRDKARSHRFRVALLVETSLQSGRSILEGIGMYMEERGPWAVFHEPRSLHDAVPQWLKAWRGDGIIARIQHEALRRAVAALGIPCVDVLGVAGRSFPLVHVDNSRVAEMAADHLREKGFRRFAYCGIPGENWSMERERGFRAAVAAREGGELAVHEHPAAGREPGRHWERDLDRLTDWLLSLETPCGLMICSDQIGADVVEACRRAGIGIPDDLGLVSVDNDEPLCRICRPPLTSIDAGHQACGYRAALELDRMMHGHSPSAADISVAPEGLVERRSSDALNLADRNVGLALRFIREFGCRPIGVDDVARASGLSRSVLQRRFRRELQHTVHEEILRTRLRKASELLASGTLPLADVADAAGFRHQEYMGAVFRKRMGITPARYRRRHHAA